MRGEETFDDLMPRGSEKILVVDDDEGIQALIMHALRNRGYSVIVADNGSHALSICRQLGEEIDLVLTDINMPILSGPEFVRRLKELRGDFKVLYMTGCNSSHDGLLSIQSVTGEQVHIIKKPFKITDLLFKVSEVLDSPGVD